MKKPAASKASGKSAVKSTKVKTKEAGETGNIKTVGNKRFTKTLASLQSSGLCGWLAVRASAMGIMKLSRRSSNKCHLQKRKL